MNNDIVFLERDDCEVVFFGELLVRYDNKKLNSNHLIGVLNCRDGVTDISLGNLKNPEKEDIEPYILFEYKEMCFLIFYNRNCIMMPYRIFNDFDVEENPKDNSAELVKRFLIRNIDLIPEHSIKNTGFAIFDISLFDKLYFE